MYKLFYLIMIVFCMNPFAIAMENHTFNLETQNTKPKRIAVLICSKFAQVPTSIDNEGLKPAFEKVGLTYEPIIWDEANIDWQQYDAVLIRATWDYIEKYENFMQVLSHIQKLGIPLLNSLETVRWNSTKLYLKELETKGVHIFDTLILKRKLVPSLDAVLPALPNKKYVIKPAISGGGARTFVTDSKDLQNIYETHYRIDEDVLIQPMIQEIVTEGEWELIFFNGEFSHAILATPKEGDFRVQRKHGGSVKAVQPPQAMIDEAKRILDLTPHGIPLYARVDFVRHNNYYYLMELEVIEPSLYLKFDENACERFAQALHKKLNDSF